MSPTRAVGAAAAWILAVLLSAGTAPAATEIEGVRFADRFEVEGTPLVLHGVGLLRYRIFFKGYVAALYLGEGVSPREVLDDVPKRLEIEYFWSIPGSTFGPAGEEILERNVPPETIASLRERLDRIDRMYPDVKLGDRLSLTYLPGQGTTLAWNGEPLGTLEGADFASAYFAIWLGEEPMNRSLRSALLQLE